MGKTATEEMTIPGRADLWVGCHDDHVSLSFPLPVACVALTQTQADWLIVQLACATEKLLKKTRKSRVSRRPEWT